MQLRKRPAPPDSTAAPPATRRGKRGVRKNRGQKEPPSTTSTTTTAANDDTSANPLGPGILAGPAPVAGIPPPDAPTVTDTTMTDAPTGADTTMTDAPSAATEGAEEPAIAHADEAPVAAVAVGADTTDAAATAPASLPAIDIVNTTAGTLAPAAEPETQPEADQPPGSVTLDASIEAPVAATKPSHAASAPAPALSSSSTSSSGPPQIGSTIDAATFGGAIQLDDGTNTTFGTLLGKSGRGVVVFTYPKANTPGCTKQACLFRDHHSSLTSSSSSSSSSSTETETAAATAAGYTIYGLSRDSPKSQTSFRQKYNLPYNLICDADGTLLKALGFYKAPRSAVRGVAVISKEGRVLGRMEGGPDATVQAARKLVEGAESSGGSVEEAAEKL